MDQSSRISIVGLGAATASAALRGETSEGQVRRQTKMEKAISEKIEEMQLNRNTSGKPWIHATRNRETPLASHSPS